MKKLKKRVFKTTYFEEHLRTTTSESILFERGTRNTNIAWKIARGYCLCYCKTFLLVPYPTECTIFLPNSTVHYSYYLKLNQRKTSNTEKEFYP